MLGDTSRRRGRNAGSFLESVFVESDVFRQGSSLKTWLYRIAIREALNHKRWFKRHLQKNVSIDAEPEEGHSAIEIEDLGATNLRPDCRARGSAGRAARPAGDSASISRAVILRDLEA